MLRWLISILIISMAAWMIISPQISMANDADILIRWMEGSFSSTEQSRSDSNYYDIRLEMVRIWPEREDGYWLYVEQAAEGSLDKPYRQRVYQVYLTVDSVYHSYVYSLPDPLRFAGEWKKVMPLMHLAPDSLELREGCAVLLQWHEDGYFIGGTEEKNCVSAHRGASYATSEVVVKHDRIVSWDRGFDEEDQQVWGAREGGYVFMKNSKP